MKYVPSLLKQIFNPESKKVAFGWQIFIWATYGAFFAKVQGGPNAGAPLMDASTWLLAVAASTALIGGGTIADKKHILEMAKVGVPNANPI